MWVILKRKEYYRKRSYNYSKLKSDITNLIQRRSEIREMIKAKRISDKFVERIMLATTVVNDCRYCTWGHTKMALKMGITKKEINSIYYSDFEDIPEEERLAFMFAQNFAEAKNQPSMESIKSLFQYYGNERGMIL